MTQRDVVLRWIEDIVRVVRRMLLGPGEGDLEAARHQVEDAIERLLGPMAQLVPRLDPASAAAILRDPERIEGLARLLDLRAAIEDATGQPERAVESRARAAEFLRLAAVYSPPPLP